MSRDKDEVVKMAREAGAIIDPRWGIASNIGTATFERFATLCRAPLVAEVERLKQAHEINADTLNAMQVEIDDWKARALKAEQVGEPFGWYSAKEDDFMLDKIRKTHERLNSHTHRIGKYDLALYTTPPQPAAQEPTSAIPVVEQLTGALSCNRIMAADSDGNYTREVTPRVITAAIAAGQKFIKESGK